MIHTSRLQAARSAIAFMLAGGGDSPETRVAKPTQWPSADEVRDAFNLLDDAYYVQRPRKREL